MNNQKDPIYAPLSYEYMMSMLFGIARYHGYAGTHTPADWKRDLRKLCKALRKAIRINIESDANHKNRLLSLCDRLDDDLAKAKTIDLMNVSYIETLTRVAFTLMGTFPNHWNRKAPHADRFWNLGGHRKLSYSQTDVQKAHLVVSLVDVQKLVHVELREHKDMDEAFRSVNYDPSRFIAWLKKEHPETYCEIF